MDSVTIEEWRRRGQHLSCDGRQIFCVDSGGDGPVVVLLHGFPTSSWDWHPLWPALAAGHRLIAPDFLGFGFSDKPRGHRYSIHEQADLVEDLLRQRGATRCHLLAHDYGDTVAQELLARDNARGAGRLWLSASLLNGGLFPETHRARLAQKLLLGPAGGLFVRLMNRGTLARNMAAIFGPDSQPGPAEIDAFWALICHNDGRANFHRLIRYIGDRREHRERWVAALREAAIPIQLINGSVDPVSGAHMVARYRELVGRGQIVELPAIGHYPQMEAPAEVARHYLAFLQENTK